MKYSLMLVSIILTTGCQTTQSDQLAKLNDRLDKTRLSLYEVNLTTCASFSLACMSLAIQAGRASDTCSEALFQCVKDAEESYTRDTGKQPPVYTTKK